MKRLFIACSILVILSALLRGHIVDIYRSFGYDEADYGYAVERGLVANYFDENSLSLFSFVKKGLESILLDKHQNISDEIRESGDIGFYRHAHPPLAFYFPILLSYIFSDIHIALRLPNIILSFLLPTIMFLLFRFLFPSLNYYWAGLSGLLLAIDPIFS